MEIDQCDDFPYMINYFIQYSFFLNIFLFFIFKKNDKIIRCGIFFFNNKKKISASRVCKSYELMKLLIS